MRSNSHCDLHFAKTQSQDIGYNLRRYISIDLGYLIHANIIREARLKRNLREKLLTWMNTHYSSIRKLVLRS